MTFYLPERTDDQQAEADRIMFRKPATGFVETFKAQAEETRILRDYNNRAINVEKELVAEIEDSLGPEYVTANPPPENETPWEARNDHLFAAIERARALNPVQYSELPTTREEFEGELRRRRLAELQEAQTVLGVSDRWMAKFAGDMWANLATPDGAALAVVGGVAGGGGILSTALIEGGLAGAEEAISLPQQYQVARDLDQPEPNPALQIGLASAGGAIIAGGLVGFGKSIAKGAERYTAYRMARDAATGDRRPEDRGQLDFGRDVTDAETGQTTSSGSSRTGQTPPDGTLGALTGPRMADFQFEKGGNASPSENRVGYVFGKLLSLGYEPHHAAALTGNMMQESGVGLNTGAIGDNGNAFGMAQWNGPRRRQYLAFARKRGKRPDDLDTQIEFLDWELKNSERSAAAKILNAPDARSAAQIASNEFWRPGEPHLSRRMAFADTLMQQFEEGKVPRWEGAVSPRTQGDASAFTGYGTRRGYTSTGQVTAGDNLRIDVEYEVVDLATLTRASGDLQPRDRSRLSSDEQVTEIAAQLDPARLMPSPEADRGAPIVGPDSVIESGNGRVMAVERAYERHPDRIDAYRQQIEAAGFEIPTGVERPVLVARRKSDLSSEQRRDFVRRANTSTTARMSATERARADAGAIDADTVAMFDPAQPMSSRANAAFARRALDSLPQAERSGLVDAGGRINAEGMQRIRQALFARAYDAPDILARFAETDAGELRSLMDALEQAAPEWAAMRAAVADGRLRAEFDITDHVLDAMRLIATAREIAAREGTAAAQVVNDLINDVDLLSGALPPLTGALVRKFMIKGRAAPADKVADFLKRYASEARKVGDADGGLFGDGPSPLDVLKRLDGETFGDLTETGRARSAQPSAQNMPEISTEALPERAFSDGAASPEAQTADDLAQEQLHDHLAGEGVFGPVLSGYRNEPQAAIERLMADQTGEVADAFVHPELGNIAFVYGNKRLGLAHIADKHGQDMLDRVPEILRDGEFKGYAETGDRAYIQMPGENPASAVIRLDFDGHDKTWLVTAFEDEQGQIARQMRTSNEPSASASSRIPDATGQRQDTPSGANIQDDALTKELRAEIEARNAQDIEIELDDGTTVSARQLLDDLDADEALETVISACGVKGGA